MNKPYFRTHQLLLLMILAIAGMLFSLGSQAHADSWMAFDESPGGAVSRDASNPTVLNQVTVVCPTTGYLEATGTSTTFLRNLPGETKSQGAVVFSISFDGRRDVFNSGVVLQNMGSDTLAHVPA